MNFELFVKDHIIYVTINIYKDITNYYSTSIVTISRRDTRM